MRHWHVLLQYDEDVHSQCQHVFYDDAKDGRANATAKARHAGSSGTTGR